MRQIRGTASGGALRHALPSGTVTFLFSDIEGSTRLLEQHPLAYPGALARHDRILRESIAARDGVVFETVGDAVYAAFPNAQGAIAAALEAQQCLHAEDWGDLGALRVRMAIHTGDVEQRGNHYFGPALYRCARLMAIGAGGQVLVSGATTDLVSNRLPAGSGLRALGQHRLKDLAEPERVYQLVHPSLPADFGPLKSVDAVRHNLPLQLTSFVGREDERARLEALLRDPRVRIVTLTGPGGVGKTRLAQEVAANLLDAFEDGVLFVSLAAISDPALVASAIAQALGISEQSAQPVLELLVDNLRDKRQLLVIDNFEQVMDAAPVVAELLRRCPGLKALVTSRFLLRITGEHALDLAPLQIPAAEAPAAELEEAPAVRLFADRARAARLDFTLGPENIRSVAEICRRLEGLPLALELVAARVRAFSPAVLNSHLAERRLTLLTSGARDAPTRHQTLRAAIAWSFDLLSPAERELFAHLGVFAGGFTVHAAARVCNDSRGSATDVGEASLSVEQGADSLELLEHLAGLVDKSLLRAQESDDAEQRFVMLDTIREFALEQLESSGDAEAVRERHAREVLRLLQEAAAHRGTPDEAAWLRRVATEHDNLRAALRWSLDRQQVDLALRMADAAWWFFLTHGHTHEGFGWLAEALNLDAGAQATLRARVLVGAAGLAHQLGDLEVAEHLLDEALPTVRASGDLTLLNMALGHLAFVAHERGNFDRALQAAEENVLVARNTGQASAIARAYTRLAEQLVLHGDVSRGAALAEEASSVAEQAGDRVCLGAALDTLGLAKRLAGCAQDAVDLLERSIRVHREVGYKANTAEALFRLADTLIAMGGGQRAAAVCAEGLRLAQESGNRLRVATGLRVTAALASVRGDDVRAAKFVAAAAGLYSTLGHNLTPIERADLDLVLARTREALGGDTFAAITTADHPPPVEDLLADIGTWSSNLPDAEGP